MKLLETILGVAILILAPLAWGLVMSWLFARRRRSGGKMPDGNGS